MSKFKVGDRVRCIDKYGSCGYRPGEEYVVSGLTDSYAGGGIMTEVDSNGSRTNGWDAARFELVTPPAKFKVGDRVRFIRDNSNGGKSSGAKGDVITVTGEGISYHGYGAQITFRRASDGCTYSAPIADLEPAHESTFAPGDRVRLTQDNEGFGRKGDVGKVVRVDEFPRVLFDNGNEVWADADRLEKVDAGLRIEAGKFYSTETGEKVGPMSFWRNARTGEVEFDCLYTNAHGGLWKPDGSAYFSAAEDSPRLVAELVEEQPAFRIEAGKFYKTRDGRKVGPAERLEGYYIADGWHYNEEGRCGYRGVHFDGEFRREHDLVAEWVDEQSAASAETGYKFKVGDRVRGTGYSIEYGGKTVEGVISCVDDSSVPYFVELDDGKETWLHRDGVTLVAAAAGSSPAIVCLIRNGQPVPATKPHVHADRSSAEKEAERLARKAPGSEFGVYELVGRRVADVTVRTI